MPRSVQMTLPFHRSFFFSLISRRNFGRILSFHKIQKKISKPNDNLPLVIIKRVHSNEVFDAQSQLSFEHNTQS